MHFNKTEHQYCCDVFSWSSIDRLYPNRASGSQMT
uniref:Uncharacterized protein n=1 Tax=Anguilla anguilla TaxID=7936 RepID=A0A0E9TG92_ANGAN